MSSLFSVGKISLQNYALSTIKPDIIITALNNHMCGVFGSISNDLQNQNIRAIMNKHGIVISNQVFGEDSILPIVLAISTDMLTGSTTISIKNV